LITNNTFITEIILISIMKIQGVRDDWALYEPYPKKKRFGKIKWILLLYGVDQPVPGHPDLSAGGMIVGVV
jgi:hypothetical protein